jgi:hypothetical protein
MRRVAETLIIVCMLALAGCATQLSQTEMDSADYGSPISQVEAESRAKEFFNMHLKDPMSAVFSWNPIYQGHMRGNSFMAAGGTKPHFGYVLDGAVNAKNSFGGYTGAQPYSILFRNGEIDRVYGPERMGSTFIQTLIYVRK